eukprot:28923-Eustigmatos_ZCMA.PRE.1
MEQLITRFHEYRRRARAKESLAKTLLLDKLPPHTRTYIGPAVDKDVDTLCKEALKAERIQSQAGELPEAPAEAATGAGKPKKRKGREWEDETFMAVAEESEASDTQQDSIVETLAAVQRDLRTMKNTMSQFKKQL